METALLLCLIGVLAVRWIYLRNRLTAIEEHLATLAARLQGQDLALTRLDAMFPRESGTASPGPAASSAGGTLVKEQAMVERPFEPITQTPEPVAQAPAQMPFTEPRVVAPPRLLTQDASEPRLSTAARSSEEWEALLGGNWLNKLGLFVLLVGIALALGYSFTRVGPMGRVLTSIAFSVAMLATGMIWERRERYRTFARGLMGGGWAALYITVFAMHSIEAARVIPDPVAGFLLLLAVAAGMIVHSLRYRSQTLTGVAYFAAFGALALAEVTELPLFAMMPLAASLVYVAHRFEWPRLVLAGMILSYGISALRGDPSATLWEAQGVLFLYWLLFEIFDVLHPGNWLWPINAAGFLGLSLLKWNALAPDRLWIFLTAAAIAYLVSAIVRIRSGEWQGAATLAAALTAAALFLKLDHQWVASALIIEAEIVYLAGIRLRASYLRWLGTALFGLEVGRLLTNDMSTLPVAAWAPVATLDAVVFYANRALFAADSFYGFLAAGMLALVVGNEAPEKYHSIGWLLLASGTFALGWWRKLPDFRAQGYLLGILGVGAAVFEMYEPALGLAIVVSYAAVLLSTRADGSRLVDEEGGLLQLAGSLAGNLALMLLLGHALPPMAIAPAWSGLMLAVLVAGWKCDVVPLRWQSYAMALLAFARCWFWNLDAASAQASNNAVWTAFLAISCFYAAMLWVNRTSRERWAFSLLGSLLTALLLDYKISGSMLTVAWGVEGGALLAAGFPLRDRVLRLSGLALLLFCILKLFVWDLRHLDTLPRIFSFIVLGLLLLVVSFAYTRYRERVSRYL